MKELIDWGGLRTAYRYDKRSNVVIKSEWGEDLSGDGSLKEVLTEFSYNDLDMLGLEKIIGGKEIKGTRNL